MIETRIEAKRGCGYRKPGGLYLIGGKLAQACGRLPIPLTVCPCCMQGIKPARGFTWISAQLIEAAECAFEMDKCRGCAPWNDVKIQKYGLLWVGEGFYPRPADFMREANMAGISKRIAQIPKELEVGKTWVMLAHRKACMVPNTDAGTNEEQLHNYTPGIFSAFIPTSIEYVCKGTETPEEIASMEKRGITLVNVIPAPEAQTTID